MTLNKDAFFKILEKDEKESRLEESFIDDIVFVLPFCKTEKEAWNYLLKKYGSEQAKKMIRKRIISEMSYEALQEFIKLQRKDENLKNIDTKKSIIQLFENASDEEHIKLLKYIMNRHTSKKRDNSES